MILNWGLENFKSIKDNMPFIELGRLNVIAGANSSGKSTFIQSILLMMQTLANRDNVAFQANGELIKLGEADDIWHYGQNSPLKFEMLLRDFDNKEQFIYIKIYFGFVENYIIPIYSIFAIGQGKSPSRFAKRIEIELREKGYYTKFISDNLRNQISSELHEKNAGEIITFENLLVRVEDFYPKLLQIETKKVSRRLDWPIAIIDPNDPRISNDDFNLQIPDEIWDVLFNISQRLGISGLETNPLIGKKKRVVNTLGDYHKWFGNLAGNEIVRLQETLSNELPGVVVDDIEYYSIKFFEQIENCVTTLFTNRIRYLSANRIPPTMLFGAGNNSSWSEVGVYGENVAPAIQEYSGKNISFWNPYKQAIEENSMLEALVVWLQFFELVNRVDTESRGKLGTLLKIYTSGIDKEFDLTSVGFGTSQILPILVQGLLTPPNSIFIVEQPEVHLHPRVQSQLADFFLSLARAGVQCIIETHSEHIVNRLRLRIVEDIGTETLDLIRIYFVEKIDSETYFRDVQANEYGAIAKWPEGFFDQVENEHLKIGRMASKKRMQKSGGK